MAPIDLRLGQNAFQVIPELSLFDIEDGKIFGFFGLDQFVLAGTHLGPRHMFLAPQHMCLGPRYDDDMPYPSLLGRTRIRVRRTRIRILP